MEFNKDTKVSVNKNGSFLFWKVFVAIDSFIVYDVVLRSRKQYFYNYGYAYIDIYGIW